MNCRQFALLAFAIQLLAFTAQAAAGPVLDRIRASEKVVIGYREASVPFSYVVGGSAPMGYAIDLCQRFVLALRKELQLKKIDVEYKLVTSSTRIPSVVNGAVDLECESTTNNADRRKQVAFVLPHYVTGTRYVVRQDSPVGELVDFMGKKLVSTVGTSPLKAIRQANRERLMGIEIGEVTDHVRGIEMVESGAADGFAMDEVLLYGLLAGRPGAEKLKIVGKYLTIEALGIMVSRDDPELKRVLDAEMRRLISTGEAAEIHDRWFVRPIPPHSRSLGLPMNYLHRDFWKFPSDYVPN
jgi:ABC-type amino acid transport substrate-binding protein